MAAGKERVECSANQISENLPVGWKTVVEGAAGKVHYTTSDGTKLTSPAQAKKYLVDKKMDVEDREEILASLEWNDDCVSPHAFARKHALFKRPCLRSAASQSPEVCLSLSLSASLSVTAGAQRDTRLCV